MLAQPGAPEVTDLTMSTLSKIAQYRPVMRPNIKQSTIEYDFDHGVLWNTVVALNVIFSSWGWRPGLRGDTKSGTAAAE